MEHSAIVSELCRELDLIHTVDPFEQESVFGEPRYYRLHGTAVGGFRYEYNHVYSEVELQKLQQLCAGVPTYCLFIMGEANVYGRRPIY